MASPFSMFRRHQATLMVVFGVALMVAFVVLPAVLQMQRVRSGNGGRSDAVWTWSKGDMTAGDVAALVQKREMAARFVFNLRRAAQNSPEGKNMNLRREEEMLFRLQANSPSAALNSLLLAQKARDMGMIVDDSAVDDFLDSVTDGVFASDERMRAEMNRAADGRVNMQLLYDTLREELLASEVSQIAQQSIGVTRSPWDPRRFQAVKTLPSEAWEYHNRMNRDVTAEFVPFNVDEYVAQVEEPSKRQISEFYDKYKYNVPIPGSPQPGFKRPHEVDFHFIRGNYEDFLLQEKLKIKNQDVIAQYEKIKDERYRIEEEPSQKPFDPNDPRQAKPRPPVPPEAEAAEDGEPKSEGSHEDAASSDDKSGDAASENGKGEAAREVDSDADGGKADAAGGTAKIDDPALPVESAAGDADAPSESAPTAEDGASTEVALPEKESPMDKTAPAADSSAEDDLTVPVKYRPLSEVEDEIRAELARRPAQERLDEAMAKARTALEAHYEKSIDFEQKIPGVEDPGEFDGAAVAKRLGLEYGETGMVDQSQLRNAQDLDIADSTQENGERFFNSAFDKNQLYQPIETELSQSALRDKRFLAWKVGDNKPFVPELDDIRDEVVEQWKTKQAREIARHDAQDLAREVDGNLPLKGQVGTEHEVLAPEPFRYYGGGIKGIEEDASDMIQPIKREVTQMRVGEVRIVHNAEKSVYYVVRLASQSTTPNEARESFMQSIVDNSSGGRFQFIVGQISAMDKQIMLNQLYGQIGEEYKVTVLDPEFFMQQGR